MSAWLIRGGRVIDPASGHDEVGDLRIEDGAVRALGADLPAAGARLIDATGLWVLPGLVETRAVLGPAGAPAPTAARELRAALAGGYTTVAVLPGGAAPPVGPDGPRVHALAALCAPDEPPRLAELGLARAGGCVAAAQAGRALPAQVLRRVLEYATGQGLAVLLDPHDHALAADGCAHAGEVALRLGLPGIPVAAEELALARGAALARLTGARVHFAGLSSAAGVAAIAAARSAGLAVSADVGLWHLLHTDADIGDFDPVFHFQPPLRAGADRVALRAGVLDGTLAVISADHRALDADAKAVPFARSAPGAAGFEAVLPVLAGLAADAEPGAPALLALLAAVTVGPAGVFGLPVGTLAIGAAADVCLYDPAQDWTVDARSWHSAGTATPVWGERVHGRVVATLVGGRPVHDPRGLCA